MGRNLKDKTSIGSIEYREDDNCLFEKVPGMNKDCITSEKRASFLGYLR